MQLRFFKVETLLNDAFIYTSEVQIKLLQRSTVCHESKSRILC